METASKLEQSLLLDTGLVERLLVEFLKDETHQAGFSRGVLGLSGGVDSAVCVTLAAKALGPDNVLGVLMPYRTSNPHSRADAELVAHTIGIKTELVEITAMVEPYLQIIGDGDRVRS
jgi:NAD+ synthase